MGVDVVHLGLVEFGVGQRDRHALTGPLAVRRRGSHVVSVAVHAEADELRIDVRAASPRMLVFLEHHDAGAVAQHEAVAVAVPRPAGAFRIVVARGQCAGRRKAADARRAGRVFRAAGNHHIHLAALDHACGEADAVRARRTGRHEREVGSLDSILDGQVPGNHVDDVAWYEERRNLARSPIEEGLVALFDAGEAAYPGTHQDADAPPVLVGHFETAVAHRLDAGRHAVVDERVHLARFLRRDVLRNIEVLDAAAEARAEVGDVERGDRADPALACDDVAPGFSDGIAVRCNDAQTSDHNATRQSELLFNPLEMQRAAINRSFYRRPR